MPIGSPDKANSLLAEKDKKINDVSAENQELQRKLAALEHELEKSKERIEKLEAKQQQKDIKHSQQDHIQSWGTSDGWGRSDGWGNQNHTKEEEKVW